MPARWSRRRRSSELFANPRHPYTQGLIRSIPRIDRAATHKARLEAIAGVGAEPARPAAGLPLRAALPLRDAATARTATPPLREVGARPQGRLHAANARAAAMTEPLLRVKDLVKHFSVNGGLLCARGRPRARRRRRQLRHRRRRDAGPGRRIGLRQVDHRPLHPAPDRADRRARSGSRARNVTRARHATRCARSAATCRSSSRTRSPRSTRA